MNDTCCRFRLLRIELSVPGQETFARQSQPLIFESRSRLLIALLQAYRPSLVRSQDTFDSQRPEKLETFAPLA